MKVSFSPGGRVAVRTHQTQCLLRGQVTQLPGASSQISKVHSHPAGFLGVIRVDICAVPPTLRKT